MEVAMKRTTKLAVAVGLALGLGTAVVMAQPYGMGRGGGFGPMHGYGPGMMGGYGPGPGMMRGDGYGPGMMGGGYNVEDRLEAQKSALKITPEQERAWTAYADVAKKQSEAMQAQHEAMWKSTPASSAERYELHSKFMAQRAEQQQALSGAYKNLYAALTPEQRTIADQGGGYGYGPRGRFR
jgi:Spy/CpxP family protein refolding chaperone